MLPPPALPLAGQAGLAQNAWVGSTVFLLSGRDWPRYLLGCSRDPLSTTPFQLFTVPGGATAYGLAPEKTWTLKPEPSGCASTSSKDPSVKIVTLAVVPSVPRNTTLWNPSLSVVSLSSW